MDKFQIISKNEAETIQIAKAIAPCFQLGDVLILDGDLGSGKTQFVKGFAEAFGSSDPVTSPTFTLAQFYNSPNGTLLHIDTYRMSGIAEFRDTGLSDFFSESIVLIEWGAKVMSDFEAYIHIQFEHVAADKNVRLMTFSHYGKSAATQFTHISQKLSNL